MGNKNDFISHYQNEKLVTPLSFKFLNVVGRGGFGKVWKAVYLKYQRVYAVKQMSKFKIFQKKCENSIKEELQILSKINHPFIANIHFAFQDVDNLYLAMDYLNGGDLRYAMYLNKKFSEENIKFIVANILLGLDYLHSNGVIHRDIKPENLIFDENGYLRITDFGIAKFIKENNGNETSGTPGYMAPEVLFGKNHSFTVDYFAIGVIIYELMLGVRPYTGANRKELKANVFANQAKIKKSQIPEGFSQEIADFANCLLKRKQSERLGYLGSREVFDHPWIRYFPWADLYKKKIASPSSPKRVDTSPKESKEINSIKGYDKETREKYEMFIKSAQYGGVFEGYYFYHNEKDDFDKANTRVLEFINPHEVLSTQEIEVDTEKEILEVNNYIRDDESDEKVGKIMNLDVAKKRYEILKEDNYMYPVTKRNSKHMKNYENNKSTLYSERSSMQTVSTFATICSKKKF